ncbi:hypothetical protein CSPX01_16442 [Colletotrichum filicis]|nr:hypothetical protein CSPX01_16442 [Colletotrichum filicis]
MSKTPRMWNLRFVSATAESQDFWKVGSRRCMCTFYNGEQTGNFLIFTSRCSFPSMSSGERTRMEQNGVRVCVSEYIHRMGDYEASESARKHIKWMRLFIKQDGETKQKTTWPCNSADM